MEPENINVTLKKDHHVLKTVGLIGLGAAAGAAATLIIVNKKTGGGVMDAMRSGKDAICDAACEAAEDVGDAVADVASEIVD